MAKQWKPLYDVSNEIITVPNALICPPAETSRDQQACGVLSDQGDVALAAMVRPHGRHTPPVSTRPLAQGRLSGRHLWGGIAIPHFGHFLCETTPRLWAFDGGRFESVLFVGRQPWVREFSPYQTDLFRALGIDAPVRIVAEPTEVEELVVPGLGFGFNHMGRGSDEFLAMTRRMAARVRAEGPEKIYISRSGTGSRPAVFGEALIEKNLAAQGYTIFHPQDESIDRQLAHYKAATHVVGIDGSAFHLLGFMAQPELRAAIILRRNANAYFTMERQLASATGRAPDIINALAADWVPPGHDKPTANSWGEIDHMRLAGELAERGYIEDADAWEMPGDDDLQAELARLNPAELVRCPVQVRVGVKRADRDARVPAAVQ